MIRNLLISLFSSAQLFSQIVSSAIPVPYRFGYNGIEIIAKTKSDSTITYSNYGAKPTIRRAVGNTIIKLYCKGLLKNGPLTVNLQCATVKGMLSIVRKNNTLISISYTWKTVVWSSGLVEEYHLKRKRK